MGGLRGGRAKASLSPGAPVTRPAPPFSSPLPAIPPCATAANKAAASPNRARVSGRYPSGRRRLAGAGEKRAGSARAARSTRPERSEGDAQKPEMAMFEMSIRQNHWPVLVRTLLMVIGIDRRRSHASPDIFSRAGWSERRVEPIMGAARIFAPS
jgi:hypothetical protein